MMVDVRKARRPHRPLFIQELKVERGGSFKHLGVQISEDLTWTLNITQLVKRSQILSNFYSCVVESTLTNGITARYSKHLQTVRVQRLVDVVDINQ